MPRHLPRQVTLLADPTYGFTGRRSAAAKKALRAAFKANDQVLALMQSDERPLATESYALRSPEEAAISVADGENTGL